MARGLNKVLLIGHLGGDPEVRYTPAGLAIASLNLATSSSVKNKQTGQWEDATEWHRVVLFERLAEVAGEFLRKGSQVYIEGRLQTRKWQDQTGQDRYTTEIVANEMQMLGGRGADNANATASMPSSAPAPSNYNAPAARSTPSARPTAPQQSSSAPSSYSPAASSANFDDDIPF